MTRFDAPVAICTKQSDAIKLLIEPKSKDLGGFSVRRVLPAAAIDKVGPFVFVDEMGPASFPPGNGINVRPHPHIGLSTVTYLFKGEILHRDSLDYVQPIQPGAVNLMTAGKGIVHSERTPEALLASGQELHGMQVWMALPDDKQEVEPAFKHYSKERLPIIDARGVTTTIIIGEYAGATSPVSVLAETIYLEQQVTAGTRVALTSANELAAYVVSGRIRTADCEVGVGQMAVFNTAVAPAYTALEDSRVMVLGGDSMSRRHMFWNFVHTSRDRIEQAKQDWRDGKFRSVKGDDEYIPLPE